MPKEQKKDTSRDIPLKLLAVLGGIIRNATKRSRTEKKIPESFSYTSW